MRRYVSFEVPERQSADLPAKLFFMLTWDTKDEVLNMNWAGLVAITVAGLPTWPKRPCMVVRTTW